MGTGATGPCIHCARSVLRHSWPWASPCSMTMWAISCAVIEANPVPGAEDTAHVRAEEDGSLGEAPPGMCRILVHPKHALMGRRVHGMLGGAEDGVGAVVVRPHRRIAVRIGEGGRSRDLLAALDPHRLANLVEAGGEARVCFHDLGVDLLGGGPGRIPAQGQSLGVDALEGLLKEVLRRHVG